MANLPRKNRRTGTDLYVVGHPVLTSGVQGLMGRQPVGQIFSSAAAALRDYVLDKVANTVTAWFLLQTTGAAREDPDVVFVVYWRTLSMTA